VPGVAFPFRPWVRAACRKALVYGLAVVAAVAVAAWLLRDPTSGTAGRALQVLLGYFALFWASLIKIWWTAGGPAVVVDERELRYQPLHAFRPRRVPFAAVQAAGPRPGTESLRFVVVGRGGLARELFLNLGVVRGRNELLDALGAALAAAGLEPVPGARHAWRRPGWEEPAAGGA
jgi:hypothetical protein